MELQIFTSFQFCILLVWSANGDAPFQGKFQVNLLNKTLGRARDPRANSAWLSKLTERNMKCLSLEDRELIRRARRDGREARGNEEMEKRED